MNPGRSRGVVKAVLRAENFQMSVLKKKRVDQFPLKGSAGEVGIKENPTHPCFLSSQVTINTQMGEHLLPTITTMNQSKAKREKEEKQGLPCLMDFQLPPLLWPV